MEDYLLTATLNAVLAQRLARRLCEGCKSGYRPEPALVEKLRLESLSGETDIRLWRAPGCPRCEHTGYRGRIPVAELMVLSGALRAAVMNRKDAAALRRLAIESGMQSMRRNGLGKALAGLTSLEEITRVTEA